MSNVIPLHHLTKQEKALIKDSIWFYGKHILTAQGEIKHDEEVLPALERILEKLGYSLSEVAHASN